MPWEVKAGVEFVLGWRRVVGIHGESADDGVSFTGHQFRIPSKFVDKTLTIQNGEKKQ